MRRPADEALEQVAVGAPDVQEGSVAVDGLGDGPPPGLPASLVAAEPRLPARALLVELRALEDGAHPVEPHVVADLPALPRSPERRSPRAPLVTALRFPLRLRPFGPGGHQPPPRCDRNDESRTGG